MFLKFPRRPLHTAHTRAIIEIKEEVLRLTCDIQTARAIVTGRVDSGDGKPDIIHDEYDARYCAMSDGFELQYDEPEAHVTITCREGMAIMNRSGIPECRMEFVPGQKRDAAYVLPEGAFDMSIECGMLSLDRRTSRGTLRIAYRIISAGQPISDNRLMISYTLC